MEASIGFTTRYLTLLRGDFHPGSNLMLLAKGWRAKLPSGVIGGGMFDLTKKTGLQSSLENIKEGVRSTKTALVEHTASMPQFGVRLAEKMMDTVSSITTRATENITTQDDQAQAALQVIEAAKAAGAKSVKVKMSKDASIGFASNVGSSNVRFGIVNDGVVELEVTF